MLTCTEDNLDLGEDLRDTIEFCGLRVRGDPIEFCWVRIDLFGQPKFDPRPHPAPVEPLHWLWSPLKNLIKFKLIKI